MRKPLVLALPLVAALAGAIGGYFALVAPRSMSDAAAHPPGWSSSGHSRSISGELAVRLPARRLIAALKLGFIFAPNSVPAIARLASQMTATSIA